MFTLGLIGIYREIRVRSEQPVVLLTMCRLLIASSYMLIAIHKERQHYYLFPAMFLPLVFLALQGYKLRDQRIVLALILLSQGLQQLPYLATEFGTYLTLTQTAKYQERLDIAKAVEGVLKEI